MTKARDEAAMTVRTATRRRGEDLLEAIHSAVFEQLRAVGYTKLTIEAVATAAQTGKAALYRRWDGKEALVLDTLRHALPIPGDVALRGDVRDDIFALMRCMQAALGKMTDMSIPFGSPEGDGGCGRTLRDCVSEPCRQMILDILRRGAEEGSVRPEAASDAMAVLGPNLMMGHCLNQGLPIPDSYVEHVVDDVLMPLVSPGDR